MYVPFDCSNNIQKEAGWGDLMKPETRAVHKRNLYHTAKAMKSTLETQTKGLVQGRPV